MQSIYKADHITEAQIVVDVLAGEDIRAWIHGAGLPSAAGELPAIGLVDVMVDDADVAAAREVIAQWKSTPVEPDEPRAVAIRSGYGPLLLGVVVGALLGALATYAVLRRPSSDRVDYDDDGYPEEVFVYAGGDLQRIDYDRNSDGEIDARLAYGDEYGESSYAIDDDFDGRMETYWLSENGQTVSGRTDRDGDGFIEMRETYRDGVGVRTEIHDPRSRTVVLEELYRGGWIDHSRIDTDGDGVLDQERKHDARGEIVATKPFAM